MMSLFTANGERFLTKKALKADIGKRISFEETSFFGAEYKGAGTYCVVLPSPLLRRAFAEVTVSDGGFLLKVK